MRKETAGQMNSKYIEKREGDMKVVELPLVEHAGKQSAINVALSEGVPAVTQGGTKGTSLMTPLGLLAGDVLLQLEARGASTVRHLAQVLEVSVSMVAMGVGSLIREGLVHGSRRGADVFVEMVEVPVPVRLQ